MKLHVEMPKEIGYGISARLAPHNLDAAITRSSAQFPASYRCGMARQANPLRARIFHPRTAAHLMTVDIGGVHLVDRTKVKPRHALRQSRRERYFLSQPAKTGHVADAEIPVECARRRHGFPRPVVKRRVGPVGAASRADIVIVVPVCDVVAVFCLTGLMTAFHLGNTGIEVLKRT